MRSSLIQAARLGGELDRRFGSLPTTEAKLGSPGLGGPKEASGEGPRPGPGAGRHGPNPKGLGGRQKANSVGGHGVERKEMSEEEEDQEGMEASGKGPEPGLGAGRHKPNGEEIEKIQLCRLDNVDGPMIKNFHIVNQFSTNCLLANDLRIKLKPKN